MDSTFTLIYISLFKSIIATNYENSAGMQVDINGKVVERKKI